MPSSKDNHRERPTRVGIDFGGTIGFVDQEEPLPHAFEMIHHLVHKFGANNVFVVSKAGPAMIEKTHQWLERTNFLERTGFQSENIIFVKEFVDKVDVVRAHNINMFLDDSPKVVRILAPLSVIERIFWMNANKEQIHLVEKKDRHKVAITKSWARTMKYVQRIPSKR